jgi:hypothetical protein
MSLPLVELVYKGHDRTGLILGTEQLKTFLGRIQYVRKGGRFGSENVRTKEHSLVLINVRDLMTCSVSSIRRIVSRVFRAGVDPFREG